MNKKIKVLFISIGYVPEVTPSDKKFVLDIVHDLSDKLDITVWSLNDKKPINKGMIIYCGKNTSYRYYSKNRIFHKHLGLKYKPHPLHSSIRNGLEINASLLWYLVTHIRSIVRVNNPDIIHLSDSIGPVTSVIKKIFNNIPVTITKPTVRLNKGLIYDLWVRLSLKSADGIFTFTKCASNRLKGMGVTENKVFVLPWGVFPKVKNLSNEEIYLIKKRYSCKNNEPLVVLIPRAIGKELYEYINDIKRISVLVPAKFVFAIRPTRYLESFSDIGNENVVVESGPSDFYNLLSVADIAIASNTSNVGMGSSSLLPLAWMESMLRETPIFTNSAPGIEELVINGCNGIIYKNEEDLSAQLLKFIGKDIEHMKKNAKESICEKFNIKVISRKYSNYWSVILQR